MRRCLSYLPGLQITNTLKTFGYSCLCVTIGLWYNGACLCAVALLCVAPPSFSHVLRRALLSLHFCCCHSQCDLLDCTSELVTHYGCSHLHHSFVRFLILCRNSSSNATCGQFCTEHVSCGFDFFQKFCCFLVSHIGISLDRV